MNKKLFILLPAMVLSLAACGDNNGGNSGIVETIHVESVTIASASGLDGVEVGGEFLELTATCLPENAGDRTVTWSSSDESIATVSRTGQVDGKAPGEVTITATSNDGGKQATFTVRVCADGELFGSLQHPLTVEQAVKYASSGVTKTAFVKGVVVTNKAKNSGSYEIWVSDGANEKQFEFYKSTFATGITDSGFAADALVGKVVIGTGKLKKYNTTMEFDATSIVSMTDEKVSTPTVMAVTCSDPFGKSCVGGDPLDLTAKFNLNLDPTVNPDISWEIVEGGTGAGTLSATTGGTIQFTGTQAGTVTVKASSGELSATYEVTVIVDNRNYGTLEAPITVTEALAIGNTLGAKEYANKIAYVEGVIEETSSTFRSSNLYYGSFYLKTGTDKIWVANTNPGDGITFGEQFEGDKIIIKAYINNDFENKGVGLQLYKSPAGVYPLIAKVSERGTSTITVNAQGATVNFTKLNGEDISSLTSAKNMDEFQFTVSVNSGLVLSNVAINGSVVTANEGVYTGVVKGNTTITINAIDLATITSENISLKFEDMGDSGWSSGYAAVDTTAGSKCLSFHFTKHNKQSSTVTDCPVGKGSDVIVEALLGKTFKSATLVCEQWLEKTQKITVETSADGTSYAAVEELSSDNFTLAVPAEKIPAGTKFLKFKFSSTSNQVGIQSFSCEYNAAE